MNDLWLMMLNHLDTRYGWLIHCHTDQTVTIKHIYTINIFSSSQIYSWGQQIWMIDLFRLIRIRLSELEVVFCEQHFHWITWWMVLWLPEQTSSVYMIQLEATIQQSSPMGRTPHPSKQLQQLKYLKHCERSLEKVDWNSWRLEQDAY